MAKIMLVEDDNNLRQIYQDRLAAEGYQIVAAQDGEEALAMAVKERPDLIIADIMMPKVSGFDMLDILRSTPETRDTKIIMMTALSQAEDKTRAEKLGADKYLIKSQVTLEDVVKVAGEMLSEQASSTNAAVASMTNSPAPSAGQPAATPAPTPAAPPAEPAKPVNIPVAAPPAAPAEPPTPAPVTPTPAPSAPAEPTSAPTPPSPAPEPPAPTPTPPAEPTDTKPAVTTIPVTTPKSDDKTEEVKSVEEKPFIPEPSQGENVVPVDTPKPTDTSGDNAKAATAEKEAQNLSTPAAKEEASVDGQIDSVIAGNPTLTTSAEPSDKKPSPATDDASAQPVEPSAPSPDASKKMEDAVNDLVGSTESNDPPASKKIESKPSSKYVSDKQESDSEGPQLAMTHERKLEPTGDYQSNAPDLNELLAKEGENLNAPPPAVGSEIQPGGGSISDPTGTFKPSPGGTSSDPGSISL